MKTVHECHRGLRLLRGTWWMLLAAQSLALGTALSATVGVGDPVDGTTAAGVALPASTCLIAVLLAAGWWRSETYKRGWRRHAVANAAYVVANLPLLLGLAVASVAPSLAVTCDAATWPALPVALTATGLFLLNRPHGAPLEPAVPSFVSEKR